MSSVRHQVGDGANTDFWRDCWCGNVPLRHRFSRLYDLSVNKVVTVRNMFLLGVEDGGGGLAVASGVVGLGGGVGRGV